ncbi:MAG: citrate/2-methylcitrate synthase, partial [Nannocystaceae bacterium]
DPRAQVLLERAHRHASGPPAATVSTLTQIAAAMDAAGHPRPALDFGLVCVASALNLPRGSATALFALGRACGWVAHIQEQREQGFLLRPRARYSGST